MTHTLISRWYLKPGREAEARAALSALAEAVLAEEPGTLAYLVHGPCGSSLPAAPAGEVTFYEVYADEAAFSAHISGPVFSGFLKDHGALFEQNFPPNSGPFMTVSTLTRAAGFVRPGFPDGGG